MEHELKTDTPVFIAVLANEKRVEMRRDDREPPYAVDDVLLLRQTAYTGQEMKAGAPLMYTGHQFRRVVTHCLRGEEYGVLDGFVALSIRPLHWHEVPNSTGSRLENN